MKDTIKISTIGKMTRAQEKFVVRELPNRGMGVVSIREINPGDMIAAENPLFIVPWWVRHSAYPRKELLRCLDRCLDNLSDHDRDAFYNLSDCKCASEDEKSEHGIWRTNNFALGLSNSKTDNGIFLTLSRFNHSCVPSAEFHWNSVLRRQEIRAIRRIQPGEEITLCYVTTVTLCLPRERRRQTLFDKYGFFCACPDCTLTGEEGRKNDELRHEVQASLETIEDLLYVNESEDEEEDPEQIDVAYRNALGLAIRRFEIMKLLGFKAICQIEACRKVVEFSIDVPDENVRKKYLHIGLELHRILYGSASHYYTDWKKKVVSAEDGTAVKQSKHSLDR